MITALHKLRIRLTSKDTEALWAYFDPHSKNYVNFNDFSILESTHNRNDPTQVQQA